METPQKLLVATRNAGKAREYRDLLAGLPFEVTWLDAEGIETRCRGNRRDLRGERRAEGDHLRGGVRAVDVGR